MGAGAEWKEAVRSYLTLLLIALSRYVGGTIKNLPDARSRDWCVVLATMRAVEDELSESTLTEDGNSGKAVPKQVAPQ